jgi:APA family basic amino acid/polyamine antiporter
MIGLSYTEMASTYPVAGGGQYYTMRGLRDIWGFVRKNPVPPSYIADFKAL